MANVVIMIAVMCAVTVGQRFFAAQVQSKICFEYARRKALPDFAELDFKDVTIATGHFHGHVCQFTDRRTSLPISLAFDAADVSYTTDTLHVCAMIVPAFVVVLCGTVVAKRLHLT